MTPREVLSVPGFSYIVNHFSPETPFGRKSVRQPYWYSDRMALEREYESLSAVCKWPAKTKEDVSSILRQFKDVAGSIERADSQYTLSILELFEIKRFCILTEELNTAIHLQGGIPFLELPGLTELLKILDPAGKREKRFSIDASFSESIDEIRARKQRIERQWYRERTQALKTERDRLCGEEQAEEDRACQILTLRIKPLCIEMRKSIEQVARIDLLLCKSRFSEAEDAVIPSLHDDEDVQLRNMRNPEIEAAVNQLGDRLTPLSILLRKGVTVITGANMGGKSVALKTLALNIALAMCGWPVIASFARLPMFNAVRFIADENTDRSYGLSSFGHEVFQLRSALSHLSTKDLILLDEPAKGTNPEEGAAILKGLTDYLMGTNCYAVIATHFSGVSNRARCHYRIKGIKDIDSLERSMPEANELYEEIIRSHMDYGLYECDTEAEIPHVAIEMCRLLGLPEELLLLMKKHVGDCEG